MLPHSVSVWPMMAKYFRFPYFIFFPFGCYILWASLLCLSHLPLSSSIFVLFLFLFSESVLLHYGFSSTCLLSASLLFSPFKSYCSPISPFSFWFFLFHSLVVMSGYLLAAACLLDSFSWILFVPSTYVYMCFLNRKVLFIVFLFFFNHT